MKMLFIFIFACLNFCKVFANNEVSTQLVLGVSSAQTFTKCGKYSYFNVSFNEPCKDMNITLLEPLGSLEIYVSKLEKYPTKRSLSWSVIESNNLIISHWDPETSPGVYYIGIYNNCKNQNITSQFFLLVNSTTSDYDNDGIFLNPSLSLNKKIPANDYEYYHFCVNKCADIKVTLENCVDSSICPKSYSYPELLVSRFDETPTIFDYTYKLADVTRRSIIINHTDPAARDHNGFLTGSYYVGIFGWCTPDEYVLNWEEDGPCSYAANSTYNVTVELVYLSDSECTSENLVYNTQDPLAETISFDQEVEGYVNCNEYDYYILEMDEPCSSINIWVGNSTLNTSVPELAVGKWPNLRPTFENLEWTSYEWGFQNLTISLWDPNFDGGKNCGAAKNETCFYYIGVYGYCAGEQLPVHYNLEVTKIPFDNQDLYSNQTIVANSKREYSFCISSPQNTSIEFLRWKDSCSCYSEYTSMQMVVSKTKRNANINDLVWSIDRDEEFDGIYLMENDVATRLGSYYLNVYGWCVEDDMCQDLCTCSPCSNVNKTKYSLMIQNSTSFDYKNDLERYLGSCGDTAESLNVCPDYCSYEMSSKDKVLSNSEMAGVIVAVIFCCLFLISLIYLYFRYHKYQLLRKLDRADSLENINFSNYELQSTDIEADRTATI